MGGFHGLSRAGDQVAESLGICGTEKRMLEPLRPPETCVEVIGELLAGVVEAGNMQSILGN